MGYLLPLLIVVGVIVLGVYLYKKNTSTVDTTGGPAGGPPNTPPPGSVSKD